MRLSFLAIASLSLASAAVAGSGEIARSAAVGAKPACTAELKKVSGTAGYAVARRCASVQSGNPALQPVEDGAEQLASGAATTVIVSLFTAGAIVAGIATASGSGDPDAPIPVSG
jgi:hypothetical protein